ncbi:VapE family protein [Paraburkholderia nemoris]|uniref:VapE domain-containing protein n=1 Tax=Paraburkholderia nemoris TaxID=2793076 RepID=UPI0038BAE737
MLSKTTDAVKANRIAFTVIEAHDCALAKRFSRAADGSIESTAIAHMTEGHARVECIDDVTQLLGVLPLLRANQAIVCGVPYAGDTALTTRAGADFRADAVARTNENFTFPDGPALFPIDVDIDDEHAPYATVDAVLDVLESCSPWLKYALRVARPSSSSFVGKHGLRGVHVYLGVTNGADIPDLAKRMQLDQWAAGKGWIKISKSGALLTRQIADAAVYQPSRLMFEAPPELVDGVTRDIPAGQHAEPRAPQREGRPANAGRDGLLHVPGLTKLREIETRKFDTAVRAAKDAKRQEAKRVAIEYQTANAIANGLDAKLGERYGLLAIRALGDRKLPPSWEIAVKEIGRVKVADILANRGDAIGHQCADPFDTWRPDIEPKHFTKAEIVTMDGKLGVWSHKLQTFFEFTTDNAADLASPLEQAAEKLCGSLEYPERVGKRAAPFVNVKFALAALLREIDAMPRQNAATGRIEKGDLPDEGKLIDALSRVGCAGVVPGVIERAVETLAKANQFDPWRDAVLALPAWDKTPRLDTFFTNVCGAPDSNALRLTGQVMFSAIIMRQLEPGIACHVVPVLIGGQGAGKSHFVGTIAAALDAPKPADVAFTDPIRMSMTARQSIVAELGEMAGIGKRDAEEIKQWIANDYDNYRSPYARENEDHPRRFILIGTANKDELNRDETGNRRFMPVPVVQPVAAGWEVECKQLFAEAKARFCQSRSEYLALHRAATLAVGAFNAERMKRGEGVAHTALADLLPDLVRRIARAKCGRVQLAEVMHALKADPSTKETKDRDAVAWLTRIGCQKVKSNGRMFYAVPEDYLGAGDELQVMEAPFNKPALAIVN